MWRRTWVGELQLTVRWAVGHVKGLDFYYPHQLGPCDRGLGGLTMLYINSCWLGSCDREVGGGNCTPNWWVAGHVRKLWIVVDYHSLGHVTEDLTGFIMPYTWTNGLTRSWWRDVSGFLDLWFQLRGKINIQNQVQTIDDGMHCRN